ncbi:MAG: hypothetical protein Kow0092_26200 [Deferrisomatales bacterium]
MTPRPAGLARVVAGPALPPGEIRARAGRVYRRVLESSPVLDGGNFTRISVGDLERLFQAYEEAFFRGTLTPALGGRPELRLSSRMTRAGGKTYVFPPRGPGDARSYRVAVSTPLLFANFEGGSGATVNGRACRDRLEALQRIFEHELVHLVELGLTGKSSCRKGEFLRLASTLFGHTEVAHRLDTPAVRARREKGLAVGDRVAFSFRGLRQVGRVNRITRRATVLVEDPGGEPYSDGKRYLKYYVPLGQIEKP